MTPTTAHGLLRGVPGALAAAGMVATPLARRGGGARRVLSSVVVGGLAASTAASAARRWTPRRAAGAAAAVAGLTAVVERVGTSTGVPFGRYAYTTALRPALGGVPVIVPLAWFAMGVPAREAARAALQGRGGARARVAAGAVALTAWDLFLDPQMVAEGYWRWARQGPYRGIPLSNFAGWFVTGLAVMGLLELLLPADDRPADEALVATYAGMAVMETVGFAAFFRDRTVALAGGAAMLPIATRAVREVVAGRRGLLRG